MTRPYDQDLDSLVLGTMRSPGVVALSGHDRADNWDIQQAKGKTGASTTLNGPPPAQFQASFYLADDSNVLDGTGDAPSDFDVWEDFQRLCESMTAGPAPFALPIYHPDLARQKITEVTKASISGAVHDGKGGTTYVVKFLEFKPPKKKSAAKPSAKAGSGIAGDPAKPDPNAAAKAELAALTDQAQRPT